MDVDTIFQSGGGVGSLMIIAREALCMYVCMSSGTHWCGAVQVITLLSTFTLASVHACLDRKH